jgi:hypothetical protein
MSEKVIAKCQMKNCGFEIHGPLIRVFFETGVPCQKCGALGTYVFYDWQERKKE